MERLLDWFARVAVQLATQMAARVTAQVAAAITVRGVVRMTARVAAWLVAMGREEARRQLLLLLQGSSMLARILHCLRRMGVSDDGWQNEEGRGREASTPRRIPLAGWKDIAIRVKDEISTDRIPLVSGGVAFYALLALFPTLVAALSLYGLVTSPAAAEQQIESLAGVLPEEARSIILGQLSAVAGAPQSGLTVAALASLVFALWSASKGTYALMQGVGIAYEQPERRGYIKTKLLSFALTLGMIVGVLLTITLIAVLPAMFGVLGLGELGERAASIARWPILLLLFMGGLAVLYRYSPDRHRARWRWVSWGSVAATLVWMAATAGLSVYVNAVGDLQAAYGTLGSVVVLLLWLYLSAFAVLFGAELNSEIEHQTAHDSTVGGDKPLGERGAVVADTVGRSYGKGKEGEERRRRRRGHGPPREA